MRQLTEQVHRHVSEYMSLDPNRPDGAVAQFQLQIEVENPEKLWMTHPSKNTHMMDVRDAFESAVRNYLACHCAQDNTPIFFEGDPPMYHLKESWCCRRQRKLYKSAILIAEFCTWERFLPYMDAIAPEDTFILDDPLWTIEESKEVQIVWKDRIRTYEFTVEAETADGDPFIQPHKIEHAFHQLNIPVLEVSQIKMKLRNGRLGLPTTEFRVKVQTDHVQEHVQEHTYMSDDGPATLRMTWNPREYQPYPTAGETKALVELVQNLDTVGGQETTLLIPDELTRHVLGKAGVVCDDVRTLRLFSLASQMFLHDIIEEACVVQQNRMQAPLKFQQNEGYPTKDRRPVILTEDIAVAAREYGMKVYRPQFLHQ